jgi:hypothetical protein
MRFKKEVPQENQILMKFLYLYQLHQDICPLVYLQVFKYLT